MKRRLLIAAVGCAALISGCSVMDHVLCAPNCTTQQRQTSSLVAFLYPDGNPLPPSNTLPQLHVPLRVGLALLRQRDHRE